MTNPAAQAAQAAADEGSHHTALFGDAEQAEAYAKHRIRPPASLLDAIEEFCGGAPIATALDVACGSGQATIELAARLGPGARVIGQDGSAAQLALAPKLAAAAGVANVEFMQADAHATGLPAGSVDLVTVSQALHWFELDRFYREVRRVLNPARGALAAWTYNNPILVHRQHAAQAALLEVYEGVLGEFWSPRRRHVEDGYLNLEPSPAHLGTCVRRQLEVRDRRSVDDVVGLVASWSAYRSYMRARGPAGAEDPLPALRAALLAALGTEDGATQMDVITPITLLLAKEPRPLAGEP